MTLYLIILLYNDMVQEVDFKGIMEQMKENMKNEKNKHSQNIDEHFYMDYRPEVYLICYCK